MCLAKSSTSCLFLAQACETETSVRMAQAVAQTERTQAISLCYFGLRTVGLKERPRFRQRARVFTATRVWPKVAQAVPSDHCP
jgi:hypothetical protein